MSTERIHRAISADGTPTAGRVRGQGPPLVLVPGGPADGETAWNALLPHLPDHFTRYTANTRGRALSDDTRDHSRARLVEDVIAFVESIGDSVVLFGHSAGGAHAPEAAARTSAVSTPALYEPTLTELADEGMRGRHAQAFIGVRCATAEDRLTDVAWIFLEKPAPIDETERAIVSEVDTVREIADVGHLGPERGPDPVSAELVRLLDAATASQHGHHVRGPAHRVTNSTERNAP